MEKNIEISGKRNIDKINNIKNPSRKESNKWSIYDKIFNYKEQVEILNKLFLDEKGEKEIQLEKDIIKKLKSYKNQDIIKKHIDLDIFISLCDCIELLVVSKLKCVFCKENCLLIYKNIYDKKQWTLDRIDNNYGHNHNNVSICCYECNIKIGDMNRDRFKKGKEIKIVRKQY